MKTFAVLLVTGVAWLPSQTTTPLNVMASPGSQFNTPLACLIATASNLQAPGFAPVPFVPLMSLFSSSTTLAYTCPAGATNPASGGVTLNLTVDASANSPFIMAVAALPGARPCGGPQGTPCMTTPTLFSSLATSAGTYHLGPAPVILLDGISPGPYPGVVGPLGQFTLNLPLAIETAANGGYEQRLAVQTLVGNPGAPTAAFLSAALNIDQWVSQ